MLYNEFYKLYQNIKNNNNYTTSQRQIYLKRLSGIIFCKSDSEWHQCYLIKLECPLITCYHDY